MEKIKAFFKQLLSTITDKDWDVDGPKLAGVIILIVGIIIMIVCSIKWDFNSPAPSYAIGLIATGSGLLGWRGVTDK